MALFIQTDATGGGSGAVDANQGAVDLGLIANGDTGFGVGAAVGNLETVTYAPTLGGTPPARLNQLVNTNFSPDYGRGAGPQAVNIIVIPGGTNFMLNDGSLLMNSAGVALPPSNSGLGGASLNGTNNCLVLYDTTQANGNGYCVKRQGSSNRDLGFPNAAILYHELSHALRICNNTLMSLVAGGCAASPEENAAEIDENDMRTQLANAAGNPVALRDPTDHCGGPGSSGSCSTCCIVASVASGSPVSTIVGELREFRDRFLRRTEIGFAFFRQLFEDYYAFSPQVCTLMAGRAALPPLVLAGFVQPLLVSLNTMKALALDGMRGAALGRYFLAQIGDRAACAESLGAVKLAAAFWSGDVDLPDDAGALATLLEGRARNSEHIEWAFLRPVAIYGELLSEAGAGARPAALGRRIEALTESWSAQMPIEPVWGSLAAAEARQELSAVEQMLTFNRQASDAFRARLAARFGHLPAIQAALAEPFQGRAQ